MDLRWYRDGDPTGFFGVKDGLTMRNSELGENFVATEEDWQKFDGINRHVSHDCYEKEKPNEYGQLLKKT